MRQRTLVQILSNIISMLAILIVTMIIMVVVRNVSNLTLMEAIDPKTQNKAVTEPTNPWLEAQNYMKTEQWDKALPLLMDAIQDAPEQAERYIALSQTHQARGNLQAALETLENGMELASDTEILEPYLHALNQTMLLTDLQQRYLQQIEKAFAQKDQLQLEKLLEKWENAYNNATSANSEVSWINPSGLTWCQKSFYAEFTGTGLAFDRYSMYYGSLLNGVPHGEGMYVAVDTVYQDEVISYMLIVGTWENGILLGETRFEEWLTGKEHKLIYTIDAILAGEEERFIQADVKLMHPPLNNGNYQSDHQFDLSITEGTLQLDNSIPGYDGALVIPCCMHEGCTASAIISTDDQSVFYQNPYPWNKDWPYQPAMPRIFLNFMYQLA
ncbi:tetratricopeptide repeat protein [Ruminococcaceae bacterium AM07-15]|nr:tetratricopeptide repeat protein [Ruminococcaceae bacterium AM07-15]